MYTQRECVAKRDNLLQEQKIRSFSLDSAKIGRSPAKAGGLATLPKRYSISITEEPQLHERYSTLNGVISIPHFLTVCFTYSDNTMQFCKLKAV